MTWGRLHIDPRRYAKTGMSETLDPVTLQRARPTADEPSWWKGAM
jgi:hypothetical protein